MIEQIPSIDLGQIVVVTTTVSTDEQARALAHAVLRMHLAACVQVEPITSHFHWQGSLHEDREWRVACKTTAEALHPLLAYLRSQHPYELPQLVVQTLQASREYAGWVEAEVAKPGAWPAPQAAAHNGG